MCVVDVSRYGATEDVRKVLLPALLLMLFGGLQVRFESACNADVSEMPPEFIPRAAGAPTLNRYVSLIMWARSCCMRFVKEMASAMIFAEAGLSSWTLVCQKCYGSGCRTGLAGYVTGSESF
jgi:hypothetical protein